ncbi:MAG: hypothetical protein ACWA6X_04525 [Bauldia sp.]
MSFRFVGASLGAAGLLISSPTLAQVGHVFYQHYTEHWEIFGDLGNEQVSPACGLRQSYQDGSSFTLYKDLVNGDLFLVVVNNAWDVRDVTAGDEFPATYNFFYRDGSLYDSLRSYLVFVNKNTITVPDIAGEVFLPAFAAASYMRIIMPGNVENAYIALQGSTEGLTYLSQCVDASTRQQQAPAQRPAVPQNLLQL